MLKVCNEERQHIATADGDGKTQNRNDEIKEDGRALDEVLGSDFSTCRAGDWSHDARI